ncbi:hypothetical protein PV10_02042 [Exophiala mesophila]|uniref:NAD(P)-binding domain-containing protein n=1 Tax=Exophiala mesophila TaxID=212818 RepID=A0A0D1ZJZ5_EXOME|nr:uncharacterized protein PV10_02042 [Exophiala mesophila]KIV94259.1 hypothetical protein PV10_02042 [Exophiala mesophila]
MANSASSTKVTLLILGAGWTYQFLQPLLSHHKISYAATTTTGHDDTIPFKFDAESDDPTPYHHLPNADYILITFPLKGRGPSAKLLSMYQQTHSHSTDATLQPSREGSHRWIQLGSTGIFTSPDWNDESSPIDAANERGIAEGELIELGGVVLNLAGLYGGGREPKNWLVRVAKTKEQLASKGALHLVHGVDVARAVVAVVFESDKDAIFGKRWIIADGMSYDWWALAWEWTGETQELSADETVPQRSEDKLKYRQWVLDLMEENNVRALPRTPELLGRKMDSRAFWKAVGLLPERSLSR